MKVNEYAKSKGVSKQSVYDRLRRGTLQYEVRDGVKHIIESSGQGSLLDTIEDKTSPDCLKTIERLSKSKVKVKLFKQEIQALKDLLLAKDAEIDTLKKTFGLMTLAIEQKLIVKPEEITSEVVKKKKKGKKKGKK